MKRQKLVGSLMFACFLVLGSGPAQADVVRVAVAANFADAARDVISLFEDATGHSVKLSSGSTGKLLSQIANGAPFEVFLSADSERARRTEQEGLAVSGTRFTYATGKLVLWSVKAGVFQDGEGYLKAMAFPRAAIGNPKTAPYGLAGQQVMEHLGIWAQVQPRLVRGESIAQAFQFTATGNAEVGFVAYAQIKAWKGDPGSLWRIPESYHAPIAQQAVLLKRGEGRPAARAFLDFLKTSAAHEIIADFGYGID